MEIKQFGDLQKDSWYVSIRDITNTRKVLIHQNTILQVAYIFKSFDDVSFRYLDGQLLAQDINRRQMESVFRVPYSNEFIIIQRVLNGKD